MNDQSRQNRSSSSVVVVILLVIIGLILIFAASGPFLGFMRWTHIGQPLHLNPFRFHPVLPLGLMSVIQIILAIWVGVDANRKGQNGLLWGLLVLFTSIVGLVIYLIVAPMLASRSNSRAPSAAVPVAPRQVTGPVCPSCRAEVQAEFKVCPQCGATLARCGKCDKAVQRDWKVCPYCGEAVRA